MAPKSMAPKTAPGPRPLWQRLAWFALIYAASVALLGLLAMALRGILG